MADTVLQREQEVRDLTAQIDELKGQDQGEIIFRENSPQKRMVTLYSMRDGCPITLPEYQAKTAIRKMEGGKYMFTSKQEEAPEYRLGEIKCFLHKDSPDQVFLKEIGLSGEANHCRKATLANEHSKRMHGMHRHREEWDAYQAFMDDHKESEAIARQERQLEATLALAGRAAGATPVQAPSVAVEAPSDDLARCHSCNEVIEGRLGDHVCGTTPA